MIGSLIGAAGSLLGGLFGSQATSAANAANIQAAREANQMAAAEKERDRELQKEFAQTGIQWKAADAAKAGIHPLYAMGANTISYAPSSTPVHSPTLAADTSMASAVGAMGQDIGRAVNATRSAGDRTDAYTKSVQILSLQKMGLENQLLSSQISKLNGAQSNPPMPIGQRYMLDGQGQTASGPLVENKAMERTPSAPGLSHQEPGAITDVGWARTASGGYMPVPSKDVKERIEDNMVQEIAHAIRNNIAPALGLKSPPPVALPKDSPGWVYDPIRGYRPGKTVPYTWGLLRY